MRTKMPKSKRTRTKHKEAPVVRTRTKEPKKKCNREYPCGGCVPDPPTSPGECPHFCIGFCGAPCVEIVNCAFHCPNRLSCSAFITAKHMIKDRLRKDLEASKPAKPPAEEVPPKKKRTRTKKQEDVPTERKKKRTRTKHHV